MTRASIDLHKSLSPGNDAIPHDTRSFHTQTAQKKTAGFCPAVSIF
jgi:hypothetical protein